MTGDLAQLGPLAQKNLMGDVLQVFIRGIDVERNEKGEWMMHHDAAMNQETQDQGQWVKHALGVIVCSQSSKS